MALERELRTERLILRRWRDADREPFRVLNADAEVMEFFPAPLASAESDALVDRIEAQFERAGYGLWAVEVVGAEPFIGFVGLSPADLTAVGFDPEAVEVGWRLARPSWGRGYATEAARSALAFGFDRVGLTEIFSFTSVLNARSQRVMQRLGLHRDAERDFGHPRVAEDSPLHRHVVYRLGRDEWRRR